MSMLGSIEIWKVINLSPDTHPFHIRLTQFQILWRRMFDVPGPSQLDWLDFESGNPANRHKYVIAKYNRSSYPAPETGDEGWKDVVRVNPGEMVGLAD